MGVFRGDHKLSFGGKKTNIRLFISLKTLTTTVLAFMMRGNFFQDVTEYEKRIKLMEEKYSKWNNKTWTCHITVFK